MAYSVYFVFKDPTTIKDKKSGIVFTRTVIKFREIKLPNPKPVFKRLNDEYSTREKVLQFFDDLDNQKNWGKILTKRMFMGEDFAMTELGDKSNSFKMVLDILPRASWRYSFIWEDGKWRRLAEEDDEINNHKVRIC